MPVLYFSLLFSLAVHTITAQATDDITTIIVTEGERVELPCPLEILQWTLNRQKPKKIIDLLDDDSGEYRYSVVSPSSSHINTRCLHEISVDSVFGSPVVIENTPSSCAGLFTCFYKPSGQAATSKSWRVTVISRDSLQLHIQREEEWIPGKTKERIDVLDGKDVTLSCVHSHNGFINPRVQLDINRNGNDEYVLASTPETISQIYLDNATSNVSATYAGQQDDISIKFTCSIYENDAPKMVIFQLLQSPAELNDPGRKGDNNHHTHGKNNVPSNQFHGWNSSSSSSAEHEELIKTQHELAGIIVGGIIAFICIVIAIIVIVIMFRRKLMKQQRRLHQMEATGIHLQLNSLERNPQDYALPYRVEFREDPKSAQNLYGQSRNTESMYLTPSTIQAGKNGIDEDPAQESLLKKQPVQDGQHSSRLLSQHSETPLYPDSQHIYEKIN